LRVGKELAICNGITMHNDQFSSPQAGLRRVFLPEFALNWRFLNIELKHPELF
jgi:hypothetical protein